MIAYNKIWLDNLAAREALEDAFHENLINAQEKQQADGVLIIGFYSPNYFIRIGLFILTIVIACFSLGLLCLVMLNGIESAFGVLLLFFGSACYAVLEFFVQTKKHYRSGVDDALLWITGICIFSGVNLLGNISPASNALLVFILATYFFLRFSDMFMSAIAGVALLAVFFFNYIKLGNIAEATASFLLMLVAAAIYFFFKKKGKEDTALYYTHCYIILEIVMLICFYAVSNYYVVNEIGKEMFGFTSNTSMAFGWLFWIFTICTPLVYIFLGIQKKDRILIRTGLLLIAGIVFTVRYYYSILPVEQLMLLGGIFLVVIAYALTKYLAVPKKGFTSAEINKRYPKEKINIEALIIVETFTGTDAESSATFGGGSFGGGGASGDF